MDFVQAFDIFHSCYQTPTIQNVLTMSQAVNTIWSFTWWTLVTASMWRSSAVIVKCLVSEQVRSTGVVQK